MMPDHDEHRHDRPADEQLGEVHGRAPPVAGSPASRYGDASRCRRAPEPPSWTRASGDATRSRPPTVPTPVPVTTSPPTTPLCPRLRRLDHSLTGAVRRDDRHARALTQARLTIGHHPLARLQPGGDDRQLTDGAACRHRSRLRRLALRVDDVHVGALLTRLDRRRRHGEHAALRAGLHGEEDELARPHARRLALPNTAPAGHGAGQRVDRVVEEVERADLAGTLPLSLDVAVTGSGCAATAARSTPKSPASTGNRTSDRDGAD